MTLQPFLISRFIGGAAFLNNDAYSTVRGEYGIVYPTVGHAYQAQKVGDYATRVVLARLPLAEVRRVVVCERPDWPQVREQIMATFLAQKFTHPHLAKRLRATNSAILIAGNYWHDNYWGQCLCPSCRHGENRLGELLMAQRQALGGVSRKAPPGEESESRRSVERLPLNRKDNHDQELPRRASLAQQLRAGAYC
jgi:hypothetical protein